MGLLQMRSELSIQVKHNTCNVGLAGSTMCKCCCSLRMVVCVYNLYTLVHMVLVCTMYQYQDRVVPCTMCNLHGKGSESILLVLQAGVKRPSARAVLCANKPCLTTWMTVMLDGNVAGYQPEACSQSAKGAAFTIPLSSHQTDRLIMPLGRALPFQNR